MYTLAQYVFGTKKSENLPNLNFETSASINDDTTACHENDPTNKQCVQTNIENDWILIEVEEDDPHHPSQKSGGNRKVAKKGLVPAARKLIKKKFAEAKLQQLSEKVNTDEKAERKGSEVMEHSSTLSVFDNFFTKVPRTLVKSFKPKQSEKVQSPFKGNKKSDKDKENNSVVSVRSTKKKQVETTGTSTSPSSAPVAPTSTANNATVHALAASNQNKAITAAILSGEKLNKKKSITKKNFERKNKLAKQRNGPIIRQNKMFTHLNGVYHNRNNC